MQYWRRKRKETLKKACRPLERRRCTQHKAFWKRMDGIEGRSTSERRIYNVSLLGPSVRSQPPRPPGLDDVYTGPAQKMLQALVIRRLRSASLRPCKRALSAGTRRALSSASIIAGRVIQHLGIHSISLAETQKRNCDRVFILLVPGSGVATIRVWSGDASMRRAALHEGARVITRTGAL